jgi:hypothetical protein
VLKGNGRVEVCQNDWRGLLCALSAVYFIFGCCVKTRGGAGCAMAGNRQMGYGGPCVRRSGETKPRHQAPMARRRSHNRHTPGRIPFLKLNPGWTSLVMLLSVGKLLITFVDRHGGRAYCGHEITPSQNALAFITAVSLDNYECRLLKVKIRPEDVYINPASSLFCQVSPIQTQKYTSQRFPLSR